MPTLPTDEIPLGSIRKYRRVRKHDGDEVADYFEDETKALITRKDKGLLCRTCGHWKPWSKLRCLYERMNNVTTRRWVCKDCSNDIKEEVI
jgi:hypothetical protein